MTYCAEALTAPVIHEDHTKDVFMGFVDGNGLSKPIPSSYKESLNEANRKYNSNEVLRVLCNVEVMLS